MLTYFVRKYIYRILCFHYFVRKIVASNVFSILSGNIYCRKPQFYCLLLEIFLWLGILWLGILWLGILLLGTLCVRNFVISNFVIRNFVPAPWAHLCVSPTVQQSVLSLEMSVLQQLVLHLDVSVQQQPVLCQKMCYSSLWCTWTVCLQKPVLHRDVSVYKSFCVHPRCLSTL